MEEWKKGINDISRRGVLEKHTFHTSAWGMRKKWNLPDRRRRHVPIDRSLIRKHVPTETESSRDSLGHRSLPDVQQFQTVRNCANFLTYHETLVKWNEDEKSNRLEEKRTECPQKGGSFTEHKIHAFDVAFDVVRFAPLCSCRCVWKPFRSISSTCAISFPAPFFTR